MRKAKLIVIILMNDICILRYSARNVLMSTNRISITLSFPQLLLLSGVIFVFFMFLPSFKLDLLAP